MTQPRTGVSKRVAKRKPPKEVRAVQRIEGTRPDFDSPLICERYARMYRETPGEARRLCDEVDAYVRCHELCAVGREVTGLLRYFLLGPFQ